MTPVVSAGEGFGQITVDQHRIRFIAGRRVCPKSLYHNVTHLAERDPIPGTDVCEGGQVQPSVRGLAGSRWEVHTGDYPGNIPSAHSTFEAATLRSAVVQKLISSIGLSRSRSAQKRQYDRKFFHGIDYTRFQRSAQGAAA